MILASNEHYSVYTTIIYSYTLELIIIGTRLATLILHLPIQRLLNLISLYLAVLYN